MIIVAIINMTIGIAHHHPGTHADDRRAEGIGQQQRGIRRIFLIDAAYILGVGIVLGDLLGIGLAVIQQQFGIVTLPVESYYVDAGPHRHRPDADRAAQHRHLGGLCTCPHTSQLAR
jgi:lipoprotein-releasing system permease protein